MSEKEISFKIDWTPEQKKAFKDITGFTESEDDYIKIEQLLKVVEKQQKEIEGGYHKGFIDGRISMKYEAQDKIIEKIKELEQEKENYFEKQVIQGRIDLLKELLGEEQ